MFDYVLYGVFLHNIIHVQGRVKFNSFGTRMDVTLNLFQYRLSTSMLQRDLIGQTMSVNETEIKLQYLVGESDNSVFPSELVYRIVGNIGKH